MLTKVVGDQGERLAQAYLEARGLRLLVANWRCRLGEIDLIMADPAESDLRVFIEVRTRRPTTYGAGSDTVAATKQRKLIRAAQLYQQQEQYWGDIRFDVVSITMAAGREPQIEHIPHAFSAA